MPEAPFLSREGGRGVRFFHPPSPPAIPPMFPLIVTLASLSPAQLPSHESANPLYKELLDPGLLVGPDLRAKLPPPSMPDGLDAAKQTAVVRQLIGNDYSYEE